MTKEVLEEIEECFAAMQSAIDHRCYAPYSISGISQLVESLQDDLDNINQLLMAVTYGEEVK